MDGPLFATPSEQALPGVVNKKGLLIFGQNMDILSIVKRRNKMTAIYYGDKSI